MGKPKKSLFDAWVEFDEANPIVYRLFKEKTLESIAINEKVGAKAIYEQLRWHSVFRTKGGSFKLCNNYPAYYARKFMKEFPEHEGYFVTRPVQADYQAKFQPAAKRAPQTEKTGQQLLL